MSCKVTANYVGKSKLPESLLAEYRYHLGDPDFLVEAENIFPSSKKKLINDSGEYSPCSSARKFENDLPKAGAARFLLLVQE